MNSMLSVLLVSLFTAAHLALVGASEADPGWFCDSTQLPVEKFVNPYTQEKSSCNNLTISVPSLIV